MIDRGSAQRVAASALVVELHDDGTYTIIKDRSGTGDFINQLILVNEDGIMERPKGLYK